MKYQISIIRARGCPSDWDPPWAPLSRQVEKRVDSMRTQVVQTQVRYQVAGLLRIGIWYNDY